MARSILLDLALEIRELNSGRGSMPSRSRFLRTEGIVRDCGDLIAVRDYKHSEHASVVEVLLAAGVEVDFERLTRHVFAS